MLDILPELEAVLGEQPAIPDLPPHQTQNRFNLVFQSFVQACAAAEHPLLIFLDDVQWADSSSLNVLELLLTDPNLSFLLIIGAYRDNEVNDAHALMLKLREIQHSGVPVSTMTLKPLTLEDVTQLLADTLHSGKSFPSQPNTPGDSLRSTTGVSPSVKARLPHLPLADGHRVFTLERNKLAELLIRKTGGNPFFLRQFLQTLSPEELLRFDLNEGGWAWNLEEIQQAEMTDNVVELMAGKIQKLPQETQHTLTLAACIGNQFDLQTLSTVYEHSPADPLHQLWDALQEELFGGLMTCRSGRAATTGISVSGNILFDMAIQNIHSYSDNRQDE